MEEDLDLALTDPHFTHPTPDTFGPPMWKSIHNIMRAYTPDKKASLQNFIQALGELLPCGKCASHFRLLVPTLNADTRRDAVKWAIDTHNQVNARLGKPVLTYGEAVQAIRTRLPSAGGACPAPTHAKCATFNTVTLVMTVLFAVALVAVVLLLVFGGPCLAGRHLPHVTVQARRANFRTGSE